MGDAMKTAIPYAILMLVAIPIMEPHIRIILGITG